MPPEAERHLAAADPVMAALIARHGPCRLVRPDADPFAVLCSAIIGQQLSSRAAETVRARVLTACGGRLAPAGLTAMAPEALRACGLSGAKARWLLALAAAVDEGRFSFEALAAMDDEAAIAALDALPGVGRWTAEMVLIFALGRPDVFALDDAGLRRALVRLYPGRAMTPRRLQQITGRWRPYRSVASWYLWRELDAELPTSP